MHTLKKRAFNLSKSNFHPSHWNFVLRKLSKVEEEDLGKFKAIDESCLKRYSKIHGKSMHRDGLRGRTT
jgi:hypothetical protein